MTSVSERLSGRYSNDKFFCLALLSKEAHLNIRWVDIVFTVHVR